MKELFLRKEFKLFLVIVIMFLIAPYVFLKNIYIIDVITMSSFAGVIALGVWLTFLIGRINIGQGAYVAIGGYTTAILMTKMGVPFWPCPLLSGLLAGIISLIIGLPILRLKGIYFAMLTLCMTKAASLLFLNAKALTNGASGIMDIPLPMAVKAGNKYIFFYYTSLILLFTVLAVIWRINNSRIGWVFKAIRQSESLALSTGINSVKYRVLAYFICSFIGGVGGSVLTVYMQSIFPASFGVLDSINYMFYCFLGGLNYLFGPIVGAFLLNIFFELLRPIQEYQELIYACIIITLMLSLPNGVLSIKIFNIKRIYIRCLQLLKIE